MLTVLAPAKLNLVLEVLGKRADGYHEIRSIVQTIGLCDTLEFELDDDLRFDCPIEELRGSDNLVLAAARLLAKAAGIKPRASIMLKKRIPWGMGLGGGSSDAAACLLGLNCLWQLGVPIDGLVGIGSRIGSDVPFFLHGGTCLVEGRGEQVIPMPDLPVQWLILLTPEVPRMSQKTERMYGALTPADFSDGGKTEVIRRHLVSGGSLEQEMLVNAFEKVARVVFPGLSEVWQRFEEVSGNRANLCGAGPALFSLQPTKAAAETVVNRLKGQGFQAMAVSWLGRRAAVLRDRVDEGQL